MTGDATELTIRSRHGVLRDAIPIYSVHQLVPNLIALGLTLWLVRSVGEVPPPFILILLLGWLYQYTSRPSTMMVTPEQAEWLEHLLGQQKFYARSETDGRWRTTARDWWQRWPHQFIAFAPAPPGVMLTAPRDVLDSIRIGLELLAEHGDVAFSDDDRAFAFEQPETKRLTWAMHVPASILGTVCVLAWIWQIAHDQTGAWGVSAMALAQGRFETIALHMFAHGGLMHLLMNMAAVAAIGGPLTSRLGPTPLNWLRFLLLFLLSGLAGAALYLTLHPAGTVPMLGASGALYGLLGLLIRAPADGEALMSLRSSKMRRIGWQLIQENAFLFVLLALMAWSSGTAGGLAWEAHLGGFLFGVFVGPRFLPRLSVAPPTPIQSSPIVVTAS